MAELNRNRTGAPRSPQRTWAEQDGRPGFPARGTHQRPRVRLSVRKAALKFANATKLNRKSGAAHESFCDINEQMQADKGKQSKHIVFGPGTLWRTWGTRPVPIGQRLLSGRFGKPCFINRNILLYLLHRDGRTASRLRNCHAKGNLHAIDIAIVSVVNA
jgi:hypothetical protein